MAEMVTSLFGGHMTCRRPIKMSFLCQIEMTLPGGFAELAYEPSALKRGRSNNGSGFVGRRIERGGLRGSGYRGVGERCATPRLRPRPPLDPDDGDISIWQRW